MSRRGAVAALWRFVVLSGVWIAGALAWSSSVDLSARGVAGGMTAFQRAVVDGERPGASARAALAGCLLAPAGAAARAASSATGTWAPDGRNPLYAAMLALAVVAAAALALGLLTRVVEREIAGGGADSGPSSDPQAPDPGPRTPDPEPRTPDPESGTEPGASRAWVGGAPVVVLLAAASPLLHAVLFEPDPAAVLALVLASALVLARGRSGVPPGFGLIMATGVALLEPGASGWLALAVWDLVRPEDGEGDEHGPAEWIGSGLALGLLLGPVLLCGAALAPGAASINVSFDSLRNLRAWPALAVAVGGLIWRGPTRFWVPLGLTVLGGGRLADAPGSVLVALLPALALGVAYVARRAARSGLSLALLVVGVALAAGNGARSLALIGSAPAASSAGPAGALAWLLVDPGGRAATALAPGDRLPPWLVARAVLAPPAAPALACALVALAGTWAGLRLRSAWAGLAALGLPLVAGIYIMSCAAPATNATLVLTYAGGGARLDAGERAHAWFPPAAPASRLDVVTAEDPRGADLVAHDTHGRTFRFPLRALRPAGDAVEGADIRPRWLARCELPAETSLDEVSLQLREATGLRVLSLQSFRW